MRNIAGTPEQGRGRVKGGRGDNRRRKSIGYMGESTHTQGDTTEKELRTSDSHNCLHEK